MAALCAWMWMILFALLGSISIASTELSEGVCSTNSLIYKKENCFSFDVEYIEFKPRNDAYFTSRDLCRKFGDPVVEFDYPQCTSKMRDVMFNYTDSNGTWVFSLQMRFAQMDASLRWQISYINFTNATKVGVHSYSFDRSLESNNDFYATLGQTYSCNMVSFMDDQGTTGITFHTVNVQAFGSSNPSDVRNCHNPDSSPVVVGIVIGCVVGSFVVLAGATLVIILVYRRVRWGNYNLLD